jgi:hypothetical protein
MGILDWLLGNTDPACHWIADSNVPIELDLDKCALCGIRLGDRCERIARLGPPDNPRPSKEEAYHYGKHGFYIDADNQSVCGFTVVFDKTAVEDKTTEFHGAIVYKGQPIDLCASIRESDFRQLFGDPYWRDADDAEHLLFYELGQVEWQVEFAKEDGLRVLTILTPPMLSDPEQRAMYNVDKPWPPRRLSGR